MVKKIMLDAGHYGKYNAGSISGYYESDMAWELHNYLKTELESYGFEVGVTRTNKNTDLEVYQRGLKGKGYDLLLSLHSNAYSAESVDKVVVIPPISGVADKLAKKLGDAITQTMNVKQAAQVYKRPISSSQPNVNYYGVVRGAVAAGTIGIIIEHSFHTNKNACKWLMNSNNLKKLAIVEAKTIADYYGVKKMTSTPTVNTSTTNANKTDTTVIYRVQTGAYSVKANAEKQLAKVKLAGFDGCIIQVNGIYKIQVGAYSVKANADIMLKKIKAAGFNAFITTQGSTAAKTSSSLTNSSVDALKVGDKVKLLAGAYIYGTKTRFKSFVYNSTLYVRQIDGSKIVISTQKTGAVTGTVSKNDLVKI